MVKIKKAFKQTAMVTLIAILLVGTSVVANAAAVQFYTVNLSTNWQTIAQCSTGINRDITVSCSVTGTSGIGAVSPDIKMLGRNGNVVWSENNSCPGLGTRKYSCGANVYKVQIRVSNGGGTARAY